MQAHLASIGWFLIHPRPSVPREFLPRAERLFLWGSGCPMKSLPPEIIEMNEQKWQELLRRAEQTGLEERDFKLIRALFESYAYVTELIDDKNTSMTRLRKLLFGREPRRRPTWSDAISRLKHPRPNRRPWLLKSRQNGKRVMAATGPTAIRALTGSRFRTNRSRLETPARIANRERSTP